MRQLLEKYESIRGKTPKEQNISFWDLVVISAGDVSQEEWFRAQLELKRQNRELPDIPYLCIADPPGPRIGSGGSTLHILTQLNKQFGTQLDRSRSTKTSSYARRLS